MAQKPVWPHPNGWEGSSSSLMWRCSNTENSCSSPPHLGSADFWGESYLFTSHFFKLGSQQAENSSVWLGGAGHNLAWPGQHMAAWGAARCRRDCRGIGAARDILLRPKGGVRNHSPLCFQWRAWALCGVCHTGCLSSLHCCTFPYCKMGIIYNTTNVTAIGNTAK